MASPSTVITLGYGSFGSVNLVPTLGYGIGEPPVDTPATGGTHGIEYAVSALSREHAATRLPRQHSVSKLNREFAATKSD